MLKKAAKAFIPYGLIELRRRLHERKAREAAEDPNVLFDGDDELFKRVLQNSKNYGEYGCGKSTKWVLNNCETVVVAVDTSKQWVEEVRSDNRSNNGKLTIEHVDLGPVGAWGRPVGYEKRDSIDNYTDFIWTRNTKPDTVLIDGRFRVSCFLTSLKYANEGTKILFDDYTNRPHYHVVENYIERTEECGRQCLFIVPKSSEIDFKKLESDIVSFKYVMD